MTPKPAGKKHTTPKEATEKNPPMRQRFSLSESDGGRFFVVVFFSFLLRSQHDAPSRLYLPPHSISLERNDLWRSTRRKEKDNLPPPLEINKKRNKSLGSRKRWIEKRRSRVLKKKPTWISGCPFCSSVETRSSSTSDREVGGERRTTAIGCRRKIRRGSRSISATVAMMNDHRVSVADGFPFFFSTRLSLSLSSELAVGRDPPDYPRGGHDPQLDGISGPPWGIWTTTRTRSFSLHD